MSDFAVNKKQVPCCDLAQSDKNGGLLSEHFSRSTPKEMAETSRLRWKMTFPSVALWSFSQHQKRAVSS
jgi:hypothetical protein